MNDDDPKLPSSFSGFLAEIPAALTPSVVKSLDRLLGAIVEVPVAWLEQQADHIKSKTESTRAIEMAVARAAAEQAEGDPEIISRAKNNLVRQAYRKQSNRDAVARTMLEELQTILQNHPTETQNSSATEVDDDWLNVFERYAEDATSERMQGLWGKVLAGEVRKPGTFSTRTLRFLSEFSQNDALTFESFSQKAFGNVSPRKALLTDDSKDIKSLIELEASGLIQGASSPLRKTLTFNSSGLIAIVEQENTLYFFGTPNTEMSFPTVVLTSLGQELLCLVGSRDAKKAAKTVANAIRSDKTPYAHFESVIKRTREGHTTSNIEVFWNETEGVPKGI